MLCQMVGCNKGIYFPGILKFSFEVICWDAFFPRQKSYSVFFLQQDYLFLCCNITLYYQPLKSYFYISHNRPEAFLYFHKLLNDFFLSFRPPCFTYLQSIDYGLTYNPTITQKKPLSIEILRSRKALQRYFSEICHPLFPFLPKFSDFHKD